MNHNDDFEDKRAFSYGVMASHFLSHVKLAIRKMPFQKESLSTITRPLKHSEAIWYPHDLKLARENLKNLLAVPEGEDPYQKKHTHRPFKSVFLEVVCELDAALKRYQEWIQKELEKDLDLELGGGAPSQELLGKSSSEDPLMHDGFNDYQREDLDVSALDWTLQDVSAGLWSDDESETLIEFVVRYHGLTVPSTDPRRLVQEVLDEVEESNGYDVNLMNPNGVLDLSLDSFSFQTKQPSPYSELAEKDRLEMVQWLVEHGVSPLSNSDSNSTHYMAYSILRNELLVIEYLKRQQVPTHHIFSAIFERYERSLPTALRPDDSALFELALKDGIEQKASADFYLAMLLTQVELGNIKNVLKIIPHVENLNRTSGNCPDLALHMAAQQGHLHICDELLKHGANLKALNRSKLSLLNATSLAQWPMLLEKYGTQLDLNDSMGFQKGQRAPSLMFAVSEGHVEVVRKMLELGADPNARTSLGHVPLMMISDFWYPYKRHAPKAIELNQKAMDLMNILLEHGAEVDAINKQKESVLEHLTKRFNDRGEPSKVVGMPKDMLIRLLSKTKQPISQEVLVENTTWGRMDLLKILLSHGLKVNEFAPSTRKNRPGQTALMRACERNKIHVVRFLQSQGASLSPVDSEGNNAFMYALRTGDLELVQWFLKEDPPLALSQNKDKQTALHMAYQYSASWSPPDLEHLTTQLVAAGVDVNHKDANGNTLLMISINRGNVKLAEHLLTLRADISCKDIKGQSVWHAIVACGSRFSSCEEMMDVLMRHGAGSLINDHNKEGYTPLMSAALTKDENLMRQLMELGADPTIAAKDSWGMVRKSLEDEHFKWATQTILRQFNLFKYFKASKPRTVEHVSNYIYGSSSDDIHQELRARSLAITEQRELTDLIKKQQEKIAEDVLKLKLNNEIDDKKDAKTLSEKSSTLSPQKEAGSISGDSESIVSSMDHPERPPVSKNRRRL